MNHNHSQSGSQTSHMILMLLCCLIPIGLILAVSIFGLSLGPLNAFLPFALVLLCPLLMFFMMRGMGHGHDASHSHHTETTPPTEKLVSAKTSPTNASAPAAPIPTSPARKAEAPSSQEHCH